MKNLVQPLVQSLYILLVTSFLIPTHTQGSSYAAISPKPITFPHTITTPGTYKLSNDISGQIIINVDGVTLDLNNYTISGSAHGVVINAGIKHARIEGGKIGPITGANGIDIGSGCSEIIIQKITTYQCDIGINANGASGLIMRKCFSFQNTNEGIKLVNCSKSTLASCTCTSNTTGILIDQSNDIYTKQSTVISNLLHGFKASTSNKCTFVKCKAFQTNSDASNNAFGFELDGGSEISLFQCLAEGTKTASTSSTNHAAGFKINDTTSRASLIQCSSGNSEAQSGGDARAYGIAMKGVLSTPTELASANHTDTIHAVACSPDGTVIAFAGNTDTFGNELSLMRLTANQLTSLDAVSPGAQINDIAWTPDSEYLAAVVQNEAFVDIFVYSINANRTRLTQVTTANTGNHQQSCSWSASGTFLATAGNRARGKDIRVFGFDKETETLTLHDKIQHQNPTTTIRWHPSRSYFAAGGTSDVELYFFDQGSKTITIKDTLIHGADIYTIAWSPNGTFLTIAGEAGTGSNEIRVYEFDATAETLTLRDSVVHGSIVRSVDWRQDGLLLAVAAEAANELYIYDFSPVTKTLSVNASASNGAILRAVAWSVDGINVMSGGDLFSSKTHKVWSVVSFANDCVIRQCLSHNNRGGSAGLGIGISAPSTTNLVTRNFSYANDIPYEFNTNITNSNATKEIKNYFK